MKKIYTLIIILLVFCEILFSQKIDINPDISISSIPEIFSPGIFFVPKTGRGTSDFLNNNIHHSSIRLIAIETALNYYGVKSIDDVMKVLEAQKQGILLINQRCNKLFIPIMKMPFWLSASKDTSSIANESELNWKVYHAYPPSNYNAWSVLIDSIVDKINNQWGLSPYYEIWNEPENIYWQDTPENYFEFFRRTYLAIKNNHPDALVGGPSVSTFTSCFKKGLPVGYLDDTQLNETIISNIIDSCVKWKSPLDFISWHKFDAFSNSYQLEVPYMNRKLIASGHGIVPYMMTEWNQTSSLRDSPFATAFMTNNLIKMSKYGIDAQVVAAWQDFDSSSTEFHKDYGLISFGGLHKPSWKAILLLDQLKGILISVTNSDSNNLSAVASKINDTIRVLISNYQLPAYVETMLNLFSVYKLNTEDLINAGFNSNTQLDSIFRGLIKLQINDSITSALNDSKLFYRKADSLFQFGREINLNFNGLIGSGKGRLFLVDSANNNVISKYDSLIKAGNSRYTSVEFLFPNDTISYKQITFIDSAYSFHLQANAVALLEIYGLKTDITEWNNPGKSISFFPNPVFDKLYLSGIDFNKSAVSVYSVFGEILLNHLKSNTVDLSSFGVGMYFLKIDNKIYKFIKIM